MPALIGYYQRFYLYGHILSVDFCKLRDPFRREAVFD